MQVIFFFSVSKSQADLMGGVGIYDSGYPIFAWGCSDSPIERLIHFEMDFLNLTYNTTTDAACNTWVCTNDFIFTILILVNIGTVQ